MSGSTEEVTKHVAAYKKVGGALMILTVVTVLASYLPISVAPAIVLALIIASVKGSLVTNIFMHLNGERPLIYWTLAITVIFWIFVMALPQLGHLDTIGVQKTLPNANAQATHASEEH